MDTLRLVMTPSAYELWLDGNLLALLEQGASALLAGASQPLRELDIEIAIERAEEWLMPVSKSMTGRQLEVDDHGSTLRGYLDAAAVYSPQDVEQVFSSVHDAVVRRALRNPATAVDVVLLRELVHHGRLTGVRVLGPAPEAGP